MLNKRKEAKNWRLRKKKNIEPKVNNGFITRGNNRLIYDTNKLSSLVFSNVLNYNLELGESKFGVILGVATAEPDKILGYTAGEGAVAFGSSGFIGGAALGGIVSAIKNSVIFFIDGDKNKWELFRKVLQ